MENRDRRWLNWLMDLSKFCAAVMVIGALAYFLFGIRFVTREEWDKHIELSQKRWAEGDVLNNLQLDNNRRVLENLERLNREIATMGERMIRVEMRLEQGGMRLREKK